MQKICVLPEEVVSRIRCGEVIQRPVNVVKELLENALDAAATEIKIKIENGGKKSIEVSDNGCGMGSEDAELCLFPHATSKIRSAEDLFSVYTLGFRGEALHSIATISMMEIKTRERGSDIGTLISNFGNKISVKAVGCGDGTHVSVKALFYNTPPRKAALKSDAAETAAITKLIGRYMLIYPQIEFSYYNNGTMHLMQRSGVSEEAILSAVLGNDISRCMKKIDYHNDDVRITGFVGSPNISRKNSDHIILSINGRYIETIFPYIKIIRDAYRGTIQSHDFPVVILRIIINPNKINPNIHPQKLEVEVLDPDLFKKSLFEAIISCQNYLRESGSDGFIFHQPPSKNGPLVAPSVSNEFYEDTLGRVEDYPQKLEDNLVLQHNNHDSSYNLPELEVIGQYRRTFIIASAPGFLFLIDQHALHEKQIFEELMEKTKIEFWEPPSPYLLHLSAEDSDLLSSSLELFCNQGLEMDQLDSDTWKCYKVPSFNGNPIPESEIINLIKNALNNLGEDPSLEDFRRKVVAEIACKSAIRANETLSLTEMTRLVQQGRHMKDAYYCPHGRPAIKVYRDATVDKWFKR